MKGLKTILMILILAVSVNLYAQEEVLVAGLIQSDSVQLEDIHVLNLSTLQGTITNRYGEFRISVSVNDTFLTNIQSDGLIVSTPTGSTAYSLSSNGPILDPSVDALLINPICPHTLSHRPFLAPGNVSISIQLTSRECAMATVDGQEGQEIITGDKVEIQASGHRTQLIRFPGRTYFEVLRKKLRWGDGLV